MKVLMTGATNGMGKGSARALAANPHVELVVLGRSESLLRKTAAELALVSAPARVACVGCDLSRLSEVPNRLTQPRRAVTQQQAPCAS